MTQFQVDQSQLIQAVPLLAFTGAAVLVTDHPLLDLK